MAEAAGKKSRTQFTPQQMLYLEEKYSECAFPKLEEREKMAKHLNLSQQVVQVGDIQCSDSSTAPAPPYSGRTSLQLGCSWDCINTGLQVGQEKELNTCALVLSVACPILL